MLRATASLIVHTQVCCFLKSMLAYFRWWDVLRGGTRPVDAADCVRNSVSCSAGRRPNAGELSTRTRLHDGVARRSPGPRKRAAIEATRDWPHKFRVRCLYNNDIRFGLLPYVMAAIVPQIWRRNIGVERMIVMLGYVWSLLSHSNTKRLRLQ